MVPPIYALLLHQFHTLAVESLLACSTYCPVLAPFCFWWHWTQASLFKDLRGHKKCALVLCFFYVTCQISRSHRPKNHWFYGFHLSKIARPFARIKSLRFALVHYALDAPGKFYVVWNLEIQVGFTQHFLLKKAKDLPIYSRIIEVKRVVNVHRYHQCPKGPICHCFNGRAIIHDLAQLVAPLISGCGEEVSHL